MRFIGENRFDATIAEESARTGVPVWVIKATIATESSFRPDVTGFDGLSWGLMQLTLPTARELAGREVTPDELKDPGVSVRLGTAYLGKMRRRYPLEPWGAVYAAYNSGSVRRNGRGEYVNSAGKTNVNANVVRWERHATYFRGSAGPSIPFSDSDSPRSGSSADERPGTGANVGGRMRQETKFEYRLFLFRKDAANEDALNSLGADGWAVSHVVADVDGVVTSALMMRGTVTVVDDVIADPRAMRAVRS